MKIGNGWPYTLLGESIRRNPQEEALIHDEEAPISKTTTSTIVPIEDAIPKFDYLAIFIGADYCPHCKELAAKVVESAPILLEKRNCKVIFASADRDEESFETSCRKVRGIDVMPYDREKTTKMRDIFDIKTIPALVVLRYSNFDDTIPMVIGNARHLIENDATLDGLNWGNGGSSVSSYNKQKVGSMSMKDRIFKGGKYGKWWNLGHRGVNPENPGKMYMDENAVRIRGGLLNILAWSSMVGFYVKSDIIYGTLPLALVEVSMSGMFGMGPLAPLSILSNMLAFVFNPVPHWKPAEPKRFAWALALVFVIACLTNMILSKNGVDYVGKAVVVYFLTGTCFILTWLEAACGFCLGCFMYNTMVVPWFGLNECVECKI